MMTADASEPADCPFCAIANGGDPSAQIVASGSDWVAFFPLRPATLGHTLVIPRTHAPDLWHLDPSLGGGLMDACIRVGQAIEAALVPDGMNLITSAGRTAEQTVFHLHLHLVPRWTTDGFGRIWPVSGKPKDGDLEEAARKIRELFVA